MNWYERSKEAEAAGVCHTEAERERGYAELDPEKKLLAVEFLRRELKEALPDIRKAIEADPDNWITPYHMFWGMAVRNLLRKEGYGEEYFDVDNLDCCYRRLIEDAAKKDGAQ
jgi:hypothetical protein